MRNVPGGLHIQHRLDRPLGPVTLLGVNFDRSEAAPGDSVLVTTLWRCEKQTGADLALRLTLRAPDGSQVVDRELPPTTGWHPTTTWRSGDVWRGQHTFHLPVHLGDGKHTWTLSLDPTNQSTNLPSTIYITAPHHTFTPPSTDIEINTRLGNVATLIGANLEPETHSLEPGASLTVTLVWRAEAETHTSYNVFLHLLALDGTLVAQSDGIPTNWTRPTTGWLPGEYITDIHVLDIPSDVTTDDYTLLTGLYIPGSERLTTHDGSSAVSLITLIKND